MPAVPGPPADPGDAADALVLSHVRHALETLRYGTITLTVHNGTVVQIDRTDRQRFDQSTR